ncbi:hypothetical protein GGR50DRAFT_463560 [Xylaria sp. CBS 124048]|nr:hypothetical protein GGR50DRAFT_463560 [Xylaria sp. CBS 124048]
MPDKSFRVIIVGAGPVGLYMAHAMERANVDYVLLERNASVLNPSGQLIFTWPQSTRLFDQLGIFEELKAVSLPIHYKKRVDGNSGDVTSTNRFWEFMERNHGYGLLPMLRSDLIRVLHDKLKGKDTNIQTNAEVLDIELNDDEARVHLKNGSIIEGSIIIGADGVHSKTRSVMHRLSHDSSEKHMLSSFHCIFGRVPIPENFIEPEVFYESGGAGAVVQALATKDRIQFVALKPMTEPSTSRRRYTDQDMEEFAESIGDVAIYRGVTFRDLWKRAKKNDTIMINQEEGLMSRWHHKRLVLVGDSVHKVTSVVGLGMTCGLLSAVVLANKLQSILPDSDSSPSMQAIEECFEQYQRDREAEVNTIWDTGYTMVRELTQKKSWTSWFWDKYILPWIDLESLGWGLIPSVTLIRHASILSYVPFTGKHGIVPWAQRSVAPV